MLQDGAVEGFSVAGWSGRGFSVAGWGGRGF